MRTARCAVPAANRLARALPGRGPRLSGSPHVAWRSAPRRLVRTAAAQQQQQQLMLASEPGSPSPAASTGLGVAGTVFGLTTAAAAVALWTYRRIKENTRSERPGGAALTWGYLRLQERVPTPRTQEQMPQVPLPCCQDERAYQRALARSRQAAHVHKAVLLTMSGEPARALVELNRALQENGICRSPLLDGAHTKEELLGLYRLHIENSEVPPNYAVLLQLQQLFSLTREEADAAEEQVLQAAGAFSI